MADVPTSKSKPVMVMTAVLAALQFINGGAALGEVLDPKTVGLIALIIGAIQVGWGVYTTGQVTPWQDVVAKATASGGVVAGPAANVLNGTPVVVKAGGVTVAPPADATPEHRRDEVGAVSTLALGVIALVAGVLVMLLTAWDVIGLLLVIVGVVLVVIHFAVNRPSRRNRL